MPRTLKHTIEAYTHGSVSRTEHVLYNVTITQCGRDFSTLRQPITTSRACAIAINNAMTDTGTAFKLQGTADY